MSASTKVSGPDFRAGVALETIADGATIRAFSHIEGATIARGCEVGPFARLRPGAVLEERSKVGNFVEVKRARLGEGAKANPLSYLGDARLGQGVNVGASTITCNYDGWSKYQTVIGDEVFVGSDTQLIAPVTIGRGAIIAAGSTITEDAPADALAITRSAQVNRPGWAARRRALQEDIKQPKSGHGKTGAVSKATSQQRKKRR